MSAISVSWLNVSWGAVYIETNYGLMQHSYIEIKNKLLRALDSEYNVTDMPAVLEVVSLLEKTPITPEILETTRLGRVINECRRRTDDEGLAKRAKLLLRHWRNMMIAPNSEIPAPISTQAISRNSSNVVFDNSKISPSSSSSPGRDPKVESVPKTHVANKRLRKNASSPPALGEPPAKVSKLNGAVVGEKHESSATPVAEVKEDLPMVSEDTSRVRGDPISVSSAEDAMEATSSAHTLVTESVPEPDPPPPKKRSRKKANKKKLQEDDIVKEKLVAMSKTVRVKTTEELVAELDRLPASTSDVNALDRNSVKPSLSNDIRLVEKTVVDFKSTQQKYERMDPETRVEREIAEIMSKLPPLNVHSIRWDSPEPTAPSTPQPITEEDVDRYLSSHWDGVNGCRTESAPGSVTEESGEEKSNFREWHEMVARKTQNDDLIHILPYSIVD